MSDFVLSIYPNGVGLLSFKTFSDSGDAVFGQARALAHALLPNGFLVAVAFASWSGCALDWVAFDRGFGTAGGGLGNVVWGVRMQLYIYLYGILYLSEDSTSLWICVVRQLRIHRSPPASRYRVPPISAGDASVRVSTSPS